MGNTANLTNSTAEQALEAVMNGELLPFLRSSHAKWISWTRAEGNALVGHIPYLRSRDLSIFRFRLRPPASGNDTQVLVTVEGTGIAYVLIPLSFAIGCLMCCVGAIFPTILSIAINSRLGQIQEELRQALEAWDVNRGRVG